MTTKKYRLFSRSQLLKRIENLEKQVSMLNKLKQKFHSKYMRVVNILRSKNMTFFYERWHKND